MSAACSLPLQEALRQTRAGDRAAAEVLWRCCAPQVIRAVQFELSKCGPAWRRRAEDLVQSVALLFFDRLQRGKLDHVLDHVHTCRQLNGLLRKMARGTVVDWMRRQNAQRRPERCGQDSADVLDSVPTREPEPCEALMLDELVQKCFAMLTPRELRIAELVRAGRTWKQVAAELGGSRDAVEKQFYRARNRVKQWLIREQSKRDEPETPK